MHSLLLLVPCYLVGSTPADRLLSPGTCMREVASQCRACKPEVAGAAGHGIPRGGWGKEWLREGPTAAATCQSISRPLPAGEGLPAPRPRPQAELQANGTPLSMVVLVVRFHPGMVWCGHTEMRAHLAGTAGPLLQTWLPWCTPFC